MILIRKQIRGKGLGVVLSFLLRGQLESMANYSHRQLKPIMIRAHENQMMYQCKLAIATAHQIMKSFGNKKSSQSQTTLAQTDVLCSSEFE